MWDKPTKTPITKHELVRADIAFLVLTSLFVLARAFLQIHKRKHFELPDFFIYVAYALFISLWSCYMSLVPPLFRVYAVIGGETEPYATMVDDQVTMIKLITIAQMCFYTLLLSVKLSLLTLYRKLLVGIPRVYKMIWWGIVAFCVVVSYHHKCCQTRRYH